MTLALAVLLAAFATPRAAFETVLTTS